MAAAPIPPPPVGPDTLITVKVIFNDNNRRFKLPLRDLGARVFPLKLRQLLTIPAETDVIFERYSDSAASYVRLDSDNPAIYKQLYRAAKAKSKLHIKATSVPRLAPVAVEPEAQPLIETVIPPEPATASTDTTSQRYSYLETVLSPPLPPRPSNLDIPSTTSDVSSSMSRNEILDGVSNENTSQSEPKIPSFAGESCAIETSPHSKFLNAMFSVECNNCGRSVPNEHYHCSICDNGDYDLCVDCIQAGIYCPGEDHWMIKRWIQHGRMVNSTTESIASGRQRPAMSMMPAVSEGKTSSPPSNLSTEQIPNNDEPDVENAENEERTCNACFKEHDVSKMVTCSDCEDYDLCMTCLLKDAHGHHPAHVFALIQDRDFCLRSLVQSRCRPGRHFHHAAVCDGCNKRIVGVRHKCMTCPDWDFCWRCMKTAPTEHPGHRFVPIYGAIGPKNVNTEIHTDVYCNGPLCQAPVNRPYIRGVRYKCAICHDTDFCAACEAHPKNNHNRTHPLIKLTTEVRSVSVSTYSDDGIGGPVRTLGDRSPPAVVLPSAPVQSTPCSFFPSSSTQTLVPEEKVEVPPQEQHTTPKEQEDPEDSATERAISSIVGLEMNALFERDTVPDGTQFAPGVVFQQTWTLRNPGPLAWPAGCSVRFVGGDSMFNVDDKHPSSVESVTSAMESNELSTSVAPGESADFTVELKTPAREGNTISYWRLKRPDGTPFGHKLWCHVEVMAKAVQDTLSKEEESSLTGSNMVFPKLDKESPMTSIHEELTTTTVADALAAAPAAVNADSQSVLEDMENLTLDVTSTDDDGFLTDEEYDILDASDQEFSDRH